MKLKELIELISGSAGLLAAINSTIQTIAAVIIVWQVTSFGGKLVDKLDVLGDSVGTVASQVKGISTAVTGEEFAEKTKAVRHVGDDVVDSVAGWKDRAASKLRNKSNSD